eukprot:EG_transcript_11241
MARSARVSLPWLLAVLVLAQPKGFEGAPERGHVEFLPELGSNESQVYRWVGQILYNETDWTVTPKERRSDCPPLQDGEPVAHAFCDGEFHPHWPHTTDHLYQCWHFFEKFPSAQRVMFSSIPNLHGLVIGKLAALNVSIFKGMPGPACTHDLVLRRRPGSSRSGWHNDEPGSNFIDVKDGTTLRRQFLRHLVSHKLHPRFSRAAHSDEPHAMRQVKIGIVNRRGSRRLLNPEVVYDAFIQHSRRTEIHTVDDMEDLGSVENQCLFFNQMDIIVTGHGAQLTNLVCSIPCTVVLEVYPPGYFLPGFFNPFAAALQLETYGIYMGADGYKDTDPCSTDWGCQGKARMKNIHVPAVIQKMPPLLLKTWHECCKDGHCHA